MKKYISLIVLFYLINPVHAAITSSQPINGIYHTQRGYYPQKYNVLPQNNLSALEKYAMNRIFPKESELNRLERLEELTFGSVQSGDIQSRYKNVESAILASPQNNYKQSWRNNFNNFLIGQPTGITPNISPFFSQNYNPSYNNSRIEQFSNGIFGNGFRIHNNSFTSGSGIRLLD